MRFNGAACPNLVEAATGIAELLIEQNLVDKCTWRSRSLGMLAAQ